MNKNKATIVRWSRLTGMVPESGTDKNRQTILAFDLSSGDTGMS